MDNYQIWLAILGWLYLLFLQNRTLKRSELSNSKDKIIKQINELQIWFESLVEKEHSNFFIETRIAAKATQIEFRFKQFNDFLKVDILDVNEIAKIRNLDTESIEPHVLEASAYEVTSDLIDLIETKYYSHLYKTNIIKRLWLAYDIEIYAVTCAFALFGLIVFINSNI